MLETWRKGEPTRTQRTQSSCSGITSLCSSRSRLDSNIDRLHTGKKKGRRWLGWWSSWGFNAWLLTFVQALLAACE